MNTNIQLWSLDEVHFQRHSTVARMWSLKGQQPHITTSMTRQKTGFFGALNLRTGRLLTMKAPTFDSDTFHSFAEYLLKHSRGKNYLILDNARWHRARELKAFFSQHRSRIVRIFLPAYSPELNPIERVWRIIRRKITHNRYFESIGILDSVLETHFSSLNKPNETLRVLCANI